MYFIRKTMLGHTLLCALIVNALSQTVLLAYSDVETTTLIYPPSNKIILSQYYLFTQPAFMGQGPQWIWVNSPNKNVWPTDGTFQTLFYSDCPNTEAILKLRVDDGFVTYLNGFPFGVGNGSTTTFTFKLNPICGLNNLTIVAINKNSQWPGAVIFKLTQDQSNCYNCPKAAYYNYDTCGCQCSSSDFTCQPNKKKKAGYPICGCVCINQPFTICKPNIQFFNEDNCSCQCKKKICLHEFQQDLKSCMCRCKAQNCGSGQSWSYQSCSCVKTSSGLTSSGQSTACTQSTACASPKEWSTASCSCICPSNIVCPASQVLDNALCLCK